MKKQINKILGYSAIFACAYLVMSAIKRKREGIGRIERIKRRIYKEVSLAQDAGVDFSKKYAELSSAELDALKHIGQDVVGWKQSKRSIESGKPYTESYYASLRRAWNAVSGIEGIGRVYNVKDANGNICLTWIEDAAAHVEAEREIEEKRQRTLEAEERAAKARKSRQRTRRAIERGGDTFYPMYSFESKEDALRQTGGKMKGNGFKVIPVWEVPIEKITGIGYAPDIETELFEIWRELLEYGDTDYDFDTWKRIYGDEYIKSSILPYM